VIRIGCVGDSQMFGWGVADEETFPSQLELALRELEPERAFEVLNLGVPNTNAEEKAARVWSTALELGCDCVVMQLFFDDDHLDGVDTGKLGRNAYWLARLRPGGYAPLDFLREHLRSVDVIADHWRRRLGSWSYVRMHEALMRPGHPARERLDAALAHAAGAASERGVELAAIVYPMAVELDGRWASAGIDAQLRDAAGSAGIATLDLSGALAACKGPLTVHPLDHHCSAAAHRAAARATATFLRDSGALERSGRRTSCAQRQAAVAPCASTR
jgi:hypothetical protein